MNHSIAIIIPYFGQWPDWIDLYFETLKRNEKIDFHFFTDCDTSLVSAPNIFFHEITFEQYILQAQEKLKVQLNIPNPYKICDLRPLFGKLHEDLLAPYGFYGWTDVDILFGDIRSFYTDEVLAAHDVFSTHAVRISGHLALFRNTEKNRNHYLKVYRWQEALLNPAFVGIDEHGISNAYFETLVDKLSDKFKVRLHNPLTRWWKARKKKRIYLQEQYTTPFVSIPWTDGTLNSDQPATWFYKDGVVTNERDTRNFMYIHFMNFKNSQWRHDGTKAPWEGKRDICHATKADLREGIVINREGIFPVKK